METGNYSNESEVFRDLIRDRISREAEITAIRAALIDGEQSSASNKTVDEIWEEAQQHEDCVEIVRVLGQQDPSKAFRTTRYYVKGNYPIE